MKLWVYCFSRKFSKILTKKNIFFQRCSVDKYRKNISSNCTCCTTKCVHHFEHERTGKNNSHAMKSYNVITFNNNSNIATTNYIECTANFNLSCCFFFCFFFFFLCCFLRFFVRFCTITHVCIQCGRSEFLSHKRSIRGVFYVNVKFSENL